MPRDLWASAWVQMTHLSWLNFNKCCLFSAKRPKILSDALCNINLVYDPFLMCKCKNQQVRGKKQEANILYHVQNGHIVMPVRIFFFLSVVMKALCSHHVAFKAKIHPESTTCIFIFIINNVIFSGIQDLFHNAILSWLSLVQTFHMHICFHFVEQFVSCMSHNSICLPVDNVVQEE